MLTAKGLLDARPRRGTWVLPEERWNLLDPDVLGWLLERKYSPALLIEFTEIRLAIEPGAATLAARVAGREEKAAIRHAIERMQAADRGDDDPLDSDIAFHVAVLRASRNRFYAQLTGFTATALRFSIQTTNRYKGVQLASIADHKKVADAILAGKTVAAGQAMHKLIQEALDLICKREALQATRRLAEGSGR
jgi:DNA-binding FadR family transcriptional regulator